METLMLGIVLLALGLAVWKIVDGFRAKHTPKITSGGVGGGTFGNAPNQHNDGSVTPPKPEGENAL